MPTRRYYFSGHVVYEQADGHDYAMADARGYDEERDGEAVAKEIADALNNTIDEPWVSDGPSIEEAGGRSILVRTPYDDLMRARLGSKNGNDDEESLVWIGDHGYELVGTDSPWLPTGWRPMPKPPGIRTRTPSA